MIKDIIKPVAAYVLHCKGIKIEIKEVKKA
jgi:hypothetical protein